MPKFLLLEVSNLGHYLAKHIFPYLKEDLGRLVGLAEVSSYSNNNYLFKLETELGNRQANYFLKQAQPYNRRSVMEGKPVLVNPERVQGEVKIMKLLADLWGKDLVPEIFYFDQKNYAFLMTDASLGGRLLIEEFGRGQVHPGLGKLFGKLFGRLHGKTFATKQEIAGSRSWKMNLLAELLDRHWGVGLRKFFSVAKVTNFLAAAHHVTPSFTWADPVYRNIFVKKNSATFFDFDHACSYDPAFDNGVLLAHWLWMGLKGDKKLTQDSFRFITDYVAGYRQGFFSYQPGHKKELSAILNRTLVWAGYYLVSRTDGKSGSYFKDWPVWEKRIRQLGIDLFGQNYKNSTARKIRQLITLGL